MDLVCSNSPRNGLNRSCALVVLSLNLSVCNVPPTKSMFAYDFVKITQVT